MRLVLATANPDKAAEMAEILAPHGIDVISRPADLADVDETDDSFLGNARLKAEAVFAAVAGSAIVVADDSGLEVDALAGAPGVRSARYAGEDATSAANRMKLLMQLAGSAERSARFRCVVVALTPGGAEIVVEGAVEGCIAEEERGSGGFGYDPLFIPDDGDGRTFGEMEAVDKHLLSHRGRAMRALAEALSRDAR